MPWTGDPQGSLPGKRRRSTSLGRLVGERQERLRHQKHLDGSGSRSRTPTTSKVNKESALGRSRGPVLHRRISGEFEVTKRGPTDNKKGEVPVELTG